jgi:glycerophosphoryl diester phosphodiesterase
MQCFAHKCNTIKSIKSAYDNQFRCFEIDISLNTVGNLTIVHDVEDINDPQNCDINDIVNKFSGCTLMLDLKARGIGQAIDLARKVMESIKLHRKNTYMICSFNEYCVAELIELKEHYDFKYEVGVISSGIPLGMFKHLEVDFISLEYSILNDDIKTNVEKGIKLYAFTVNSQHGKNICQLLGLDGIIYDSVGKMV